MYICYDGECMENTVSDIFFVVERLNRNKNYVSEMRFESESIYIQFDDVYKFEHLPNNFHSKISTCYDCPYDWQCKPNGECHADYRKPITILFYSEPNFDKTPEQLMEIANDIVKWVNSFCRPIF